MKFCAAQTERQPIQQVNVTEYACLFFSFLEQLPNQSSLMLNICVIGFPRFPMNQQSYRRRVRGTSTVWKLRS